MLPFKPRVSLYTSGLPGLGKARARSCQVADRRVGGPPCRGASVESSIMYGHIHGLSVRYTGILVSVCVGCQFA